MKPLLHLFVFLMLFFASNFSVAQKQVLTKADSLVLLISNYKSPCVSRPCVGDTTKINFLIELSGEYVGKNSDTVLQLVNEALRLAQNINYPVATAYAYNALGVAYKEKSEYDSALNFYNKAVRLLDSSRRAGNNPERADALNIRAMSYGNMANVFQRQGNLSEAIDYNLKTIEIAETMGNKIRSAICYSNLGGIYLSRGLYPDALAYYIKSLKVNEQLGKKRNVAKILANIGIIHKLLGNFPKALSYYFDALKLAGELGDEKGVSTDYGSISNVYIEMKDYSTAHSYLDKALKIDEENNFRREWSVHLANMGNILDHETSHSEALKYYFKSIKLSEEIGDTLSMVPVLNNIGSSFLALKKYDQAKVYIQRSLILAQRMESLEDVQDANENLSKLYEATNNYKLALSYFKQAVTTKDSIFNEEKENEITRKVMTYEQEKKDVLRNAEQEKKDAISKAELDKQKLFRNSIAGGAGIIVLSSFFSFLFYKRKRDAVQRQKETSLSLQVSETEMKALRSQMNPHFIFNALQSIQTFLMSHKPDDANTYLLKFSKLMRLVLENSQHSEVPLKDDIQALELYMQLESIRLPHPFTYQFHIDKSIDEENDTIPPLILQPFVENAIWHGLQYKSQPGHINVYIRKKDNTLYATVEDNGVGRDMTKKPQQPLLMKKESLGMKLTEERLKILNELKKIKAQFEIIDLFTRDNRPAGTKVELSLPLVA